MAQHLTSLNNHFDMCVKAVRATEGGAALARRRAAEATDDGEPVSISGVITEQESHLPDLEPMEPQELAEIVQVVMEDAPEVDEVVAEIQATLQQMEQEFGILKEQADRIRAVWMATLTAFQVLEELETRLQGYVSAKHEFEQRWKPKLAHVCSWLGASFGGRRRPLVVQDRALRAALRAQPSGKGRYYKDHIRHPVLGRARNGFALNTCFCWSRKRLLEVFYS